VTAVAEQLPLKEYLLREELAEKGLLREYLARCAEEGASPAFVAMSLLRQTPGSKTDREFVRDFAHGKQFDTMGPTARKHILSEAKKAGINIAGKIYKGGLGKPGDPLAWVSDSGDVLRAAKAKALHVTGRVNYEPPGMDDRPPPPRKALADDIVRTEVLRVTAANPDLAAKCREKPALVEELKQQVIEKHGKKRKVGA
jgi:hypothetical protein